MTAMPTTPYRSPLLDYPGAVPLDDTHSVAWHYGNPLGEQALIERTGCIVDRSDRVVFSITGPDATTFLNSLLTQKLDTTEVGFSSRALNLDYKGHIQHVLWVTHTPNGWLVDMPSDSAASCEAYFRSMIFWSDLRIERTDWGILTLLGTPPTHIRTLLPPDGVLRPVQWSGPDRLDIFLPRSQLNTTVMALTPTLPLIGLMAFDACRVRAGDPERYPDMDGKTLPHEIPAFIGRDEHVGALHLHKGCYPGQETVARIENLGQPPRVLVMVHIDGSSPYTPIPGDPLFLQGSTRTVGRMGTLVQDYEYGPIALALVKRSVVFAQPEPPLVVGCDGLTAVRIDPESIPTPAEENDKAGRAAVEKLRAQRKASAAHGTSFPEPPPERARLI